jgi:hypothetical protein
VRLRRRRRITLRAEQNGQDHRFLWAYLDADGALHIDGQDLGPATSTVSSDGEYEWFETIAAKDIPRLVELLGGKPGSNVSKLLRKRYTGARSYELESILRDSGIHVERSVWGG